MRCWWPFRVCNVLKEGVLCTSQPSGGPREKGVVLPERHAGSFWRPKGLGRFLERVPGGSCISQTILFYRCEAPQLCLCTDSSDPSVLLNLICACLPGGPDPNSSLRPLEVVDLFSSNKFTSSFFFPVSSLTCTVLAAFSIFPDTS